MGELFLDKKDTLEDEPVRLANISFAFDPKVRGFGSLAKTFFLYVAGKITYDRFMAKWWKSHPDAREQFKKFVSVFRDVREEIFN